MKRERGGGRDLGGKGNEGPYLKKMNSMAPANRNFETLANHTPVQIQIITSIISNEPGKLHSTGRGKPIIHASDII